MEPPILANEKVTCADCNNSSDPITLDDFKDVPGQYIFKVEEANIVHCFDIRALYK